MYRNSNSLSAGLSIARHLPSSKSHDSLDIEYFDALKGHSGPSETSPDSRIPSDELLDGSPIGSSKAPNIGHSILQKSPVDIEIDRGHRQAAKILDELRRVRIRPAKNVGDSKYEPYDSGYIPDDDMRPRS
ncbi:hypothetical protein NW764_014933 [Fusarium oxysporum]|nr:hypothetical protein NW764_014933 [Fusarium oxysporum]